MIIRARIRIPLELNVEIDYDKGVKDFRELAGGKLNLNLLEVVEFIVKDRKEREKTNETK